MGDEVPLHGGGYRASIDLVGAALRSLSYEGVDLVPSWPDDLARPLCAGVTCAPWPNRVADARYAYGAVVHHLVPTPDEPGHALHGLVSGVTWRITAAAADRLRLITEVEGAPGWPFGLSLTAEYHVSAQGFSGRLSATNTGSVTLPYGCCPHPYLVAPPTVDVGRSTVDAWALQIPADSVLAVDDRKIPVSQVQVERTPMDFRTPRLVGTVAIDHCFGDLRRDADGRARVRLGAPGATVVTELSWGGWAPWVQVYSGDRPSSPLHRTAIAVEPMSCPPDAYNSGIDLIDLAPGATHEAQWSIGLVTQRRDLRVARRRTSRPSVLAPRPTEPRPPWDGRLRRPRPCEPVGRQ